MLKKFVIFYIFLAFIFLRAEEPSFSKKFNSYKTDRWELITDLPESFAILFAEYSENFSTLIYEFLSEMREENNPLQGRVYLFQSCEEYSNYLQSKFIKVKNLLHFTLVSQKSWSEFEIAGCILTTGHLYEDFQKKITKTFLFEKEKKYPNWLKTGLQDYFAYSSYIADDLSIVPYINFDYTNSIYKFRETQKTYLKISQLLKTEQANWKKNKFIYKAYSWAFVSYLMDKHLTGRSILKSYIQEVVNLKKSPSEKLTISQFDEEDWIGWLEKFPLPKGLEYYRKAQTQTIHSSRKQFLQLALAEFPDYWLYQKDLAYEYYANDNFVSALEMAEKTLQLKLNSRITLEIAITSSFKLGQYPKTEFYLWLCDEFKYCKNRYNQERIFLQQYKKNNPDIKKFKSPIVSPGSWF